MIKENKAIKLQTLRKEPQAVIVHHVDENGVWATNHRTILHKPVEEKEFQKFAKFPFSSPRDFFSWSRPTTRAIRADKCNIFPVSTQRLLGIRAGKVYQIEKDHTNFLFSIKGDAVLHGGITDFNGDIYFGEYFMNPDREPVRIWRVSKDLERYEIAYTFDTNSIRHVHGVYSDPYNENKLWTTVGDFENECYLLTTDDKFKTVRKIGDGTQIWRAVGLLFSEDSVHWLTDSHLKQNYIVSMNRDDLQLNTHGEVSNSTWYSTETSDGIFLAATTVEKGEGIKEDKASLLISEDGIKWNPVKSFKKDFWPMPLFKFGVISFPSGNFSSSQVWISGEGLIGLDGCSLLCSLEPND